MSSLAREFRALSAQTEASGGATFSFNFSDAADTSCAVAPDHIIYKSADVDAGNDTSAASGAKNRKKKKKKQKAATDGVAEVTASVQSVTLTDLSEEHTKKELDTILPLDSSASMSQQNNISSLVPREIGVHNDAPVDAKQEPSKSKSKSKSGSSKKKKKQAQQSAATAVTAAAAATSASASTSTSTAAIVPPAAAPVRRVSRPPPGLESVDPIYAPGPVVLSYRDPELSEDEKHVRKFGLGINVSAIGPRAKALHKDPNWVQRHIVVEGGNYLPPTAASAPSLGEVVATASSPFSFGFGFSA